jgi:hypothetical protein
MKKIFYEKIGKRYIPVSEYDDTLMRSFPKGSHLVVSRPGVISFSYNVDPTLAPMLAAGKYAQDKMAGALVNGQQKYKAMPQPITPRQKELWDELAASFITQDFMYQLPSAHDAAQAGIDALAEEVEKMMTVPAVKLAYDHFMMVWKLTKDKENND